MAFVSTVAFEVVAEVPYFMEPHAGVLGLHIGMGLFCLCTAAVAVCAAQRRGAVKQTPRRAVKPGRVVMAVAMVLDVVYDVLHMVTTRRHAGQRGGVHCTRGKSDDYWLGLPNACLSAGRVATRKQAGQGRGGRGDEVGCSTEDRPERGEWRVACRTRR